MNYSNNELAQSLEIPDGGPDRKETKRAERRHRTNNAIERQVAIAKQYGQPVANDDRHRMAKHHAMDCGQPNCGLCGNSRHSPTTKGEERLTIQERSANQSFAKIELVAGEGGDEFSADDEDASSGTSGVPPVADTPGHQ
jgi:hypothetical protein